MEVAKSHTCRFVILCQPRSGSSLLNSSLRRHPQIFMHREILNYRQRHQLPERGAERLQTALSRRTHAAVGCNLHAYQPDRRWAEWSKWEPAWQVLAEDEGIKVIHLRRLDVLAQLVSWRIARKLGRWGEQADIAERPTVHIDPEELNWFHCWNEAVYQWRLSHLGEHTILPITYESLCDRWDETLRRIQEFLGVQPRSLPQAVRKNEHRPMSEVVENWHDFAPHCEVGIS